ncbi:MAG: MFS transporter, partial [Alistipes sp.]|nr:MFS transporter [Alistipes sp.]
MTEIYKRLNDSPAARWTALLIVSFTMMCGYFITDVMAPLEDLLTKSPAEGGLGWTSDEYGFFSGAYGYINVFLLMLFFGGIILDKCGVRFTGTMSSSLMFVGALLKWYALDNTFGDAQIFGYPVQVALAALGFAIFGMGAEITGITVTKIIAKWFTGHELALAMGLQVAMARIGTAVALACSLPIANKMGAVSAPVLLGAALLCVGVVSFLVYCVMDKKLDASVAATEEQEPEEGFHFSDLKVIFTNKGFWLIAILCVLFYSGVFPFLKFATKLMIYKYGVEPELAGLIPAMLPFGTILLTPVF